MRWRQKLSEQYGSPALRYRKPTNQKPPCSRASHPFFPDILPLVPLQFQLMNSHHTSEKTEVVWRTLPSTHCQGQQRTCLYSLVTLVSFKGQPSVLCPSTAFPMSLSLPPVVSSLPSGCLFPLHSWLTADKHALVALSPGKSKAKVCTPALTMMNCWPVHPEPLQHFAQ